MPIFDHLNDLTLAVTELTISEIGRVLHLLDARRLETVQRLFHGYPEEAQKKWLEYGSFEFWAILDRDKKLCVMRFARENQEFRWWDTRHKEWAMT